MTEAKPKPVKVVQIKKSPQMWSIKIGTRYVMGFAGKDARARAIAFAAAKSPEYEIVEKPTTKREQARLDANAGLSNPT